jgi:S-DNA-T family DNA segregation ATPase FtsK/SpoIIIE
MKKRSKKAIQEEMIRVTYMAIIIMVLVIAYFKQGPVGLFLYRLSLVLFGTYPLVNYLLIALISLLVLFKKKLKVSYKMVIAAFIIFSVWYLYMALSMTDYVGLDYIQHFLGRMKPIFLEQLPAEIGLIGALFYGGISALIHQGGVKILIATLIILAIYLLFGVQIAKLLNIKLPSIKKANKPARKKPRRKLKPSAADEFESPSAATMDEAIAKSETKKAVFIDSESVTKPQVVAPPVKEVKVTSAATVSTFENYTLPSLNLLDAFKSKKGSSLNNIAAQRKGKQLIDLLDQFQIPAELIEYHIGPAITKFEIRPDSNVKVSKIASLSDNIKMNLKAKDIRIEAPIPGRNAVGVEIPNVEVTPVRLLELIENIPEAKKDKQLLFILGKNLMGQAIYGELDKMPHLLIAGATGSGKSVAVNALITTLLLRTTPSQVKMLLIDPKKVEFTPFHEIPHLIAPVVSDASEAARALKVMVGIMEERYELFASVETRNISAYNEKVVNEPHLHLEIMPKIVVIIDELADLMAVAGKDVEGSIQRITQLARAAGIHLIVATQRPSTDVITGIIKANIPSRIAFAVTSHIDSRTILDASGAEKLLGYGDMLYVPIGEPHPTRIQGVFVSDDEVKRVAQAATGQAKPHFDDAFMELDGVEGNEGYLGALDDPLYEEVKAYIIATQRASTSMIQRRFSLGYNRAARIMDTLFEQNIIGPPAGSKAREVLVASDVDE